MSSFSSEHPITPDMGYDMSQHAQSKARAQAYRDHAKERSNLSSHSKSNSTSRSHPHSHSHSKSNSNSSSRIRRALPSGSQIRVNPTGTEELSIDLDSFRRRGGADPIVSDSGINLDVSKIPSGTTITVPSKSLGPNTLPFNINVGDSKVKDITKTTLSTSVNTNANADFDPNAITTPLSNSKAIGTTNVANVASMNAKINSINKNTLSEASPVNPNVVSKANANSISNANARALGSTVPLDTLPASDMNTILANIRKDLEKWQIADNSNLEATSEFLNVGDKKISRECFLHFVSEDPSFLPESRAQCSDVIASYVTASNELSLSSLLSLSSDHNITRDTAFYDNLYGFNVGLAEFVATKEAFQKASPKTQAILLAKIRDFTKQSLLYLNQYMDTYQVMNPKLMDSSYNLLYLLNNLTYSQANMGNSVDELNAIYAKVNAALAENIGILNKAITSKDNVSPSKASIYVDPETLEQIRVYSEALKKKLAALQEQKTILESSISTINSNKQAIQAYASPYVKKIGDELEQFYAQSAVTQAAQVAQVMGEIANTNANAVVVPK